MGLCDQAHEEKRHQLELSLEQAHYEASRARRQYDAVDPDNRLVAGELEARWKVLSPMKQCGYCG